MQNKNFVNYHDFDLIVVNSSGGKDSLCALYEIVRKSDELGYPREKIIVSHQCLGHMEWPGTLELVQRHADYFGLKLMVSKRKTQSGELETILDYTKRRGKWPSNKQRWCTSDFKRGPGARVVTELTKGLGKSRVLYVFGFRAAESPARSKKQVFSINKTLTTKSRQVIDYLPIHDWSNEMVWRTILQNKLEYHNAYDLGMPRLSCVFCIFSPFDALVIAGKANPELLDEYIAVEQEIGHTFRNNFSIASVKEAIENSYTPAKVADWVM